MTYETKYFYSQDGARWSDLQPVDAETVKRAGRIKGQLSGDPAKNYELEEKDLNAPPPGEDEEEKKLVFQIPELSVLRYRVDSIVSATSIIPTVGAKKTLLSAAGTLGPRCSTGWVWRSESC